MARFIVAGAGIGGLSAALALAHHGFPVTLLERRATLAEGGAGIQLSPNATRHFREWGVLDALTKVGTRPEAIRIRRGRDGAELARLSLQRERDDDSPFLLLHRADFQRVLAAAARASPLINLQLATSVDDVAEGSTGVVVSVAGPGGVTTFEAAGFISAAGLHDATRQNETVGPSVRFSGRVAWRSLVAAAGLPSSFLQPSSNLWLGTRAHLVHYPLRGGSMVNVVAIVDDAVGASDTEFWEALGNPATLLARFARWDDLPRHLIEAAPSWHRWPLFDRPPGTRWSFGYRTVLGDAAHPMLPFLAQGASQAVEDAAALANAVAANPADVAVAFRHYESARRPRAERVQRASRLQGQIYHLGGASALARDAAMRLMGPRRMLRRMDWLYQGG